MLLRAGGVTSSRDLTLEGFDAAMAEFNRLGFTTTPSKRKPKGAGGSAPNRPTPAQWRLMEDRARKVGYEGLEDPRFIASGKTTAARWKTRVFFDMDGARRVIAALGNWIERRTE